MHIQRSVQLATVMALLTIAAIGTAEDAEAATWNWDSSCSFDITSCNDFNTATLSIFEIHANTLSWTGDGYFHSHSGSPVTMFVDLLIGGDWQNVFQATTTATGADSTNLLSGLILNRVFTGGSIFGIRLRANLNQNYNFHRILGDSFTLGITAEVPSPATLPLLGAGLGFMGLFGWIRRRRATPSLA